MTWSEEPWRQREQVLPPSAQELVWRDSDYQNIGDNLTFDAVTEYQRVISPKATHRESMWDNFEGLGQSTNNGTADRYTLVETGGGTARVQFTSDGTIGKTYFSYINAGTGVGVRNYLVLGLGGTPPVRTMFRAAENPSFKVLVLQSTAPVGGTQDVTLGFRGTDAAGLVTGLQDGIHFRSTDGGAWTLVCRSGGTESTLAMPAAPSSTLALLELRVQRDGAEVLGFYNNRYVGKVTTNIPTGLFLMSALHDNRAITVTTVGVFQLYGWGFERDLIA